LARIRENYKDVSSEETTQAHDQLENVKPHTQEAPSVVKTAVIGVVDVPIPGVMRVTKIEVTRVFFCPDRVAPMSRDIPKPDSLGGSVC
jgi:hypothetical protein